MGALFTKGTSVRDLIRTAVPEIRKRVASYLSQIVLAVIAGVLAWTVAGGLIQDHSPFFAPIAAVIALNAAGGERGANAIRLLTGVFIGILCGEFALLITDRGTVALAVATTLAMIVAAAVKAERIVIGQAAASAILTTIFIADGSPGLDRLIDAFIGAGAALLFSQLLFPVRLVTMLRRIEEDALEEMATMLNDVGRSLADENHEASVQMGNRLGDLSRPMAQLSKARESSMTTIRTSTIRWGDPQPVLDEDEVIERLILLGESCLFLARGASSMDARERRELAPIVYAMAEVLTILSDDLSSREVREQAVERALSAAREYGAGGPDDDAVTHATHLAVEMVAIDIMVFAGIRFEDVEEILLGEVEDPTIPHPPQEPWLPWLRWRPRPPDIRFGRFRERD